MGIWNKDKHTFTVPNYLHNEYTMEGMFEGTVLTSLYLDQDPSDMFDIKWTTLMTQIFIHLTHGHM